MDNANTARKQTSWGWIIFWFILFWPVGLVLLIKRQNSDKSAALRSYKGIIITSYVLMGLGAIYFLMGVTGQPDALIAFLVFGGGGVVTFLYARKSQKKSEHYKKYINMVVNQNQTSIDSISAAVDLPYSAVLNDLQNMVSEGYLPGAYVDISQRKIILGNVTQQMVSPTPVSNNITQPQTAVVICSGCSANNKVVVGQSTSCEYCGTFLQ